MVVGLVTVNRRAVVGPNLTEVVLVRLVPVKVTKDSPEGRAAGRREAREGGRHREGEGLPERCEGACGRDDEDLDRAGRVGLGHGGDGGLVCHREPCGRCCPEHHRRGAHEVVPRDGDDGAACDRPASGRDVGDAPPEEEDEGGEAEGPEEHLEVALQSPAGVRMMFEKPHVTHSKGSVSTWLSSRSGESG